MGLSIVYVSDFFLPEIGGIQTHIYDLARFASRAGHEVTVITTVGRTISHERSDGFDVIRIPYPRYAGLLGLNGLWERYELLFRAIDPDIVHAHHVFSPSGLITGAVARSLGLKSLVTNHSIPVGYELYKRFWIIMSAGLSILPALSNLNSYDYAIAVSDKAAEYLKIFYKGRIKIIPPPIDYDFFNYRTKKSRIGFREDDLIVLFVGRLAPKKGLELALYSFRIVLKYIENAHLVIVGDDSGTYGQYLKNLARILGLEKNIHFVGKVSRARLREFYGASDIFIFPSYGGESFGIVVLEAMAAGLPVVAAVGGALAKYIKELRLGMITGLNPAKFAAAIIYLLKSEDLRREISCRARRFAKLFSWDYFFSKIERLYYEVLNSDRKG